MRIFISQPMTGRRESDIMHERECIINEIRNRNKDFNIDFVATTYDKDYANKHPLDMLGNCIKELAKADKVVFAPGWESSKGSKIEHMCAVTYGIPCLYIGCIELPDNPHVDRAMDILRAAFEGANGGKVSINYADLVAGKCEGLF